MQTVATTFQTTVTRLSNQRAIQFKKNGQWAYQSWLQYKQEIDLCAKSLIELGLKAKDFVAILSQNNHKWVKANLAAIFTGAVPAGIYPTNSTQQIQYILNHCKAKILFCENSTLLKKIESIWENCPFLQKVVLLTTNSCESSNTLGWDIFLELGRSSKKDQELKQLIALQKPEDLASLVYTSGTTSAPKAVMLSHQNLLWTASTVCEKELHLTEKDSFLSYLPLSHIAEQMMSIYGAIVSGATISFAESMETVPQNLREIKPTIFLGVPRVWEKMQEKITAKIKESSFLKRKLIAWVQANGSKSRFHRWFSNSLVCKKMRQNLGFDKSRYLYTAAAPISKETLDFFESFQIPLFELYGMSESTGPITLSSQGTRIIGKTGVALRGTKVKIAEDGEIMSQGPHVFSGYLYDKKSTEEALDENNWLKTGDLGVLDSKGFLKITGRKKNLLITAGGENVAPEAIEQKLNTIPGVEHSVVVGDQKKYLSALLTLSDEAFEISKSLGSKTLSKEDLSTCQLFYEYLTTKIKTANEGLARVQGIKKFVVLPKSFSVQSDELTPTMKVKRAKITHNYQQEINQLYH